MKDRHAFTIKNGMKFAIGFYIGKEIYDTFIGTTDDILRKKLEPWMEDEEKQNKLRAKIVDKVTYPLIKTLWGEETAKKYKARRDQLRAAGYSEEEITAQLSKRTQVRKSAADRIQEGGWTPSSNLSPIDPTVPPGRVKIDVVVIARKEADLILERMKDAVSAHGCVTTADLRDLLGMPVVHIDKHWGWRSSEGFSVIKVDRGWQLVIPTPVFLD